MYAVSYTHLVMSDAEQIADAETEQTSNVSIYDEEYITYSDIEKLMSLSLIHI